MTQELARQLPEKLSSAYKVMGRIPGRCAMFLDVHELELHEIAFDETLPPGKIDFGFGIQQLEPLAVRGKAVLLETEIHLSGSLKATVATDCDRCLEVTRRPVALDF